MISQKPEAVAPIVRIAPNPSYPGASILAIRCPFCREEHGHGITGGEKLLGVPLHRGAHCNEYDTDLRRKGLHQKRRQQLEAGLALRERCGRRYAIRQSIALFAEFKSGQLVGLRLGEMRKMRIRTTASGSAATTSQGRARV
ncbi:hypothetical protein [Halomonas sp. 25-S5]|uniref:hypothetical protein n=1 Tax=Halomonas sp. 25-S5 TaxID=2994065 RepID=UPI002468917D|nr:hypothetical protein [Halomonas sp. 25-S5]